MDTLPPPQQQHRHHQQQEQRQQQSPGEAIIAQRVFWFGRHPKRPEWKNPLGRVHSPRGACGPLLAERRTLEDLGFRELDAAAGEFAVPAFTWIDRHGARGSRCRHRRRSHRALAGLWT